MAGVHADPEVLEDFLRELRSFRQLLLEEGDRLWEAMGKLRLEWRDQEFEKFASSFLRTWQHLRGLMESIQEIEPHLNQDIEFLRAYLNTPIPVSLAGGGQPVAQTPSRSTEPNDRPSFIYTYYKLPPSFLWVRLEDLPQVYPDESADTSLVHAIQTHLKSMLQELQERLFQPFLELSIHFMEKDRQEGLPTHQGLRRVYEAFFGDEAITAYFEPGEGWKVLSGGRTLCAARKAGMELVPVRLYAPSMGP